MLVSSAEISLARTPLLNNQVLVRLGASWLSMFHAGRSTLASCLSPFDFRDLISGNLLLSLYDTQTPKLNKRGTLNRSTLPASYQT